MFELNNIKLANIYKIVKDIELFGYNNNKYFIFKYNTEDNINFQYIKYETNNEIIFIILQEILNKVELWNLVFTKSHSMHLSSIFFNITINTNKINNYLNSPGLKYYLYVIFLEENRKLYEYKSISIISDTEPYIMPCDFKIKLYNYQQRTVQKMLNIENNKILNIKYSLDLKINNLPIIYDPIINNYLSSNKYLKLNSSGGILSDEMGLGKTITSIALITANPCNNLTFMKTSEYNSLNKLNSKATLILCPPHIVNQWKDEIKWCNPKLKVISIVSKTDYNKLKYIDFIENDIIITSFSFITNFNFYLSLHYKQCTKSIFKSSDRNYLIKNYINENIKNNINIDDLKNPIFEFFNFHRFIIDEAHELFCSNNNYKNIISDWITNIDSTYNWYVSGTPFITFTGIKQAFKFIKLNLSQEEYNMNVNFKKMDRDNNNNTILSDYINQDYLWNILLNRVSIKHSYLDVIDQVKIPENSITNIWIELTPIEQNLYNANIKSLNTTQLQKLCCHPLILDSNKKICGGEENLIIIQDTLIIHHKKNYEKYTVKLENLNQQLPEYYMLKKNYETLISESKYMYTLLNKMKSSDNIVHETCSICIDEAIKPALTYCGHIFCYDCIIQYFKIKKICPICKINLSDKKLGVINPEDMKTDIYSKYGSKIGKLMTMINDILLIKNSSIIIFSQWDDMLKLISKTLNDNSISNTIIKGNTNCRSNAINKFKNSSIEDTNKIIMLSLKNTASGTDLKNATHIFLIEPINDSSENIKLIESQAIGRAHRIGQKNNVKIIRILTKNTIEEEIYNKYY